MHLPADCLCTSSDSAYPSTALVANLMMYHGLVISEHCSGFIMKVTSLVPRPHPSSSAKEKGLVKINNIPGPEAGISESQSDHSICN